MLFVHSAGNCLMERASFRTGDNVMHVLRHVIEQLVSHNEIEYRIVENMTGNAPYDSKQALSPMPLTMDQDRKQFRPLLVLKRAALELWLSRFTSSES